MGTPEDQREEIGERIYQVIEDTLTRDFGLGPPHTLVSRLQGCVERIMAQTDIAAKWGYQPVQCVHCGAAIPDVPDSVDDYADECCDCYEAIMTAACEETANE